MKTRCISVVIMWLLVVAVTLVVLPCLAIAKDNASLNHQLARAAEEGNLSEVRAMGQVALIAAARYVELNPVRARLVRVPGESLWSNAAAHIAGLNDDLVKVAPLLGIVEDWSAFPAEETATEHAELLRLHERTRRPLGGDEFIGHLE